jgi:hypothetical protein
MLVRVQSNGRKISGLLLRSSDAHSYFSESNPFIELQLGELHIHCRLDREFWQHRPVIADQRLCDWLDTKVFHGRACRTAPPLELIPTGDNSFTLKPPAGCDIANCPQPEAIAAGCVAGLAAAAKPGPKEPAHCQQPSHLLMQHQGLLVSEKSGVLTRQGRDSLDDK